MSKRVLLITYYWPPSGGAGVYRWLKMSRYLSDSGWIPTILTGENVHYPVYDQTLSGEVNDRIEVWKVPFWEPYNWYKRWMGFRTNQNVQHELIQPKQTAKWKSKIAMWIRGNLFIPDPRVFWIRPALKLLNKKLPAHSFDAMISTGPPHSVHLIAEKVYQKFKIPWIADFRDPWRQIDYYEKLPMIPLVRRKHLELEKRILTNATRVITVSKGFASMLQKTVYREIDVVENGFDEFDFKTRVSPDEHFLILHVGTAGVDRNPEAFWEALQENCNLSPEFQKELKIHFIGKIDYRFAESAERSGLKDHFLYTDYIPHKEACTQMQKARILLLLVNDSPAQAGKIPAKVYEYMAAKRPILCLGKKDSDAAKLLAKTGAGITVDLSDTHGIRKCLMDFFIQFKQGSDEKSIQNLKDFTRREKAKQVTGILDQLSGE